MINNKLLNKTSICILVLILVILVIVLFYNYFNRHKIGKEKFYTEPSINGKTVKITCQNCNGIPQSYGSDVNLFAVFIYDDNGQILNYMRRFLCCFPRRYYYIKCTAHRQ